MKPVNLSILVVNCKDYHPSHDYYLCKSGRHFSGVARTPEWPDYNEELHNKTIATEATEKAALEMIRLAQSGGIPDAQTKSSLKNLGLNDYTIDELFAQIDAETANLIQ